MKNYIITMIGLVMILNSSAQESKWMLKTGLLALIIKGEPNLYLERINVIKRRGYEIGMIFHQPVNSISILGSAARYPVGFTSGGEYGLQSVTPFYDFYHIGWTNTLNYKFYSKSGKLYFGPQVAYSYKQLKGVSYSDYDPGPVTQRPHYRYTANHYSKQIGLLFNVGSNYSKEEKKRKSILEYGMSAGIHFKFEDLVILSYGGGTISGQSPNFKKDIESGKITDGLNGFFISPALKFYCRYGIKWR